MAEDAAGRPTFTAIRQAERTSLIEKVGAELRAMMPFLDPVGVNRVYDPPSRVSFEEQDHEDTCRSR